MIHAATISLVSFEVRFALGLFRGEVRGTADRIIDEAESFCICLPQPSGRFGVCHPAWRLAHSLQPA
jgi:hypothetical protein